MSSSVRAREPSPDKGRVPASLLLGVVAGAMAAVTIMPTMIPLTESIATVEELASFTRVEQATSVMEALLLSDSEVAYEVAGTLAVDQVAILEKGEVVWAHGAGPDVPLSTLVDSCADQPEARSLFDARGTHWAIACERLDERAVLTAWRHRVAPSSRVTPFVLGIASLVGLITAMAVLGVLSPLSRISEVLGRVEAGERGVRVNATGLPELDELVDRINAATRTMEEREDAILARIQVVQEMSRMVAHEIRNPLQSLELLTTLIASEEVEAERMKLAASLHDEIRTLDAVVSRLLRRGAGKGLRLNRTEQLVGPILEKVLAFQTIEARRRGVRLLLEGGCERPLPMDGVLVGRSIENLVINALQALPSEGGTIRVASVDKRDHLEIVVEDDGPGVSPALAETLFDANVSGRVGGTGLGLALVKGVFEAHGGYIGHDRSPLGGARFTAHLPFEEPEDGGPSDPGGG